MSAAASEGEARLGQTWSMERNSGEGEEEEEDEESGTVPSTPKPAGGQEEMTEVSSASVEVPDKGRSARVQSVFSLVRSQIRVQAGLESRRSGMLQLVQRVTRQLERSKGEQAGSTPDPDATSPVEEAETAPEVQGGTVEEEEEVVVVEKEGESRKEVCVVLLQEVLDSVESLRREVLEELRLLRQESRRHMEEALLGLEMRLVHSLHTQALAPQVATTLPRPHPALLPDVKKHKPLSVPPLGASRRRKLSRTMTTITAKTCPPPSLGPRSLSEPLGGRAAEAALRVPPRGADPLVWSLGPLPPSLPAAQQGKRPLRSKTRVGKPAP